MFGLVELDKDVIEWASKLASHELSFVLTIVGRRALLGGIRPPDRSRKVMDGRGEESYVRSFEPPEAGLQPEGQGHRAEHRFRHPRHGRERGRSYPAGGAVQAEEVRPPRLLRRPVHDP